MVIIDVTEKVIIYGTENVPNDWKHGRVTMIAKTYSLKRNLRTCRRLTVSPILHRIFAKIIEKITLEWIEDKNIMGEMQSGFRRGRREDNIFILTSAIELSKLFLFSTSMQ